MNAKRVVRGLFVLTVATIVTACSTSNASAQIFRQRNDWPTYRTLRDLQGQSYSDVGPAGRGYYTPMWLPGIDDTNGPSRAYSPIFNAPQAAPRGSWLRSESLNPPGPARDRAPLARGLFFRRGLRRR